MPMLEHREPEYRDALFAIAKALEPFGLYDREEILSDAFRLCIYEASKKAATREDKDDR